jgi:hypothetical protein
MNFKISLLALFCSLLLCNCLDQSEPIAQTKRAEETKSKVNRLVFEIDLETSVADDFILFANDIFLNNSQFMNLGITHKLNMNETSKKMTFELPEGIKPDVMLGLSLGKKSIKEVTIKNIKLTYGNAIFNIQQNELIDYFSYNQFIDYDAETYKLTTKKVDNNLNPLLFLRRKILDSIQKQE